MPFEPIDRFKYNKSPLDKAICQLRFPPILRIDTEIPTDFQERVKHLFPIYQEQRDIQTEFTAAFSVNAQTIVNQSPKVIENKRHNFTSEDGKWTLTLTRTFIAITVTNYDTWETFCEKFSPAVEALIDIYEPPFCTRTGLRYIDIFDRDKLGLKDEAWIELINPSLIGLLGGDFHENILGYNNTTDMLLADEVSKARITTALMKNRNQENCLLFDVDLSTTEKLEFDNIKVKLEYLHDRSSRLLRYAITEKLHDAMEPVKI